MPINIQDDIFLFPFPPPFCDTWEIFLKLFNIVQDYLFHTLIVSVPKKKRAVLLSSGEGEPSKRNNARCLSVCHQVSPLLPPCCICPPRQINILYFTFRCSRVVGSLIAGSRLQFTLRHFYATKKVRIFPSQHGILQIAQKKSPNLPYLSTTSISEVKICICPSPWNLVWINNMKHWFSN